MSYFQLTQSKETVHIRVEEWFWARKSQKGSCFSYVFYTNTSEERVCEIRKDMPTLAFFKCSGVLTYIRH
jgi:hypothetical protein